MKKDKCNKCFQDPNMCICIAPIEVNSNSSNYYDSLEWDAFDNKVKNVLADKGYLFGQMTKFDLQMIEHAIEATYEVMNNKTQSTPSTQDTIGCTTEIEQPEINFKYCQLCKSTTGPDRHSGCDRSCNPLCAWYIKE